MHGSFIFGKEPLDVRPCTAIRSRMRRDTLSVKCLPCRREDLSSVPKAYVRTNKEVSTCTYSPSFRKAETGKSLGLLEQTDRQTTSLAPDQWEVLTQKQKSGLQRHSTLWPSQALAHTIVQTCTHVCAHTQRGDLAQWDSPSAKHDSCWALMTWVWSPGPTWRTERTNSYRLPSDLHIHYVPLYIEREVSTWESDFWKERKDSLKMKSLVF